MDQVTPEYLKMIDEAFKMIEKDGKVILPEFVSRDMVEKGYNPINKDDIQRYWLSKGIDTYLDG